MLRPGRLHRLRLTRLSSLSAFKKDKVASKEYEETYATVFNRIMDRSTARTETSQSALLFEQTFKSLEKLKDSAIPRALVTPRLLRTGTKHKVSLSSSSSSPLISMSQSEELARSESLHTSLEQTLAALDGMKSDLELFEFMEPLILQLNVRLSKEDSTVPFDDALRTAIQKQSDASPLEPLCNEHTVPLLLIKVLGTLNEKFQSPDAALTLFELAKQQSLKTYVFLCVIGVYNQVLKLHWEGYKSVSCINTLLSDLKVNGIQGNSDTITVLGAVSREAHTMLQGDDLLSFSLEKGPEQWVPMWNQSDADELLGIDTYIADLYEFLEKGYA